MRLYELLNESAQVKFDQLERRIRSSDMTVSEFMQVMKKEYGVHTIFNLDQTVQPFYADGAEITSRRHSAQAKNTSVPREAHGKYVMTINVGPGSTRGNLPVKEITNFTRLVRHELGHAAQSKGGFSFGDYYGADTSHKNPIQAAMYYLQNTERSQQVVDLATHLSNLGGTPEIFFDLFNQAKAYVRSEVEEFDDVEKVPFKDIRIALRRMVFSSLRKTTGSKSEDTKSGFDHAYLFISHYIESFAFASLHGDAELAVKPKINAFKRALQKQFKSVDAIQRSHRADSVAAHKKNNPKRIRQRENLKLRRKMMRDGTFPTDD